MKQTEVSIIIVSYNTMDYTLAAIQSVYDQTDAIFELIVIDNASSDGSADAIADRFPLVQLFRLDYNAGFAGANNIGVQKSSGQFVLLLNPDTVVMDHAIDKIVTFGKENPEYGVYGGSTFFADGSRNPTSGWGKPTVWSMFCTATGLMSVFRGSKIFDSESLAWWDWREPKQVGMVTGCFMLLQRKFWDELGGFDERFHMYAEDADLSFRASATGRPCIIVPSAAIIHYGGASERVRADKTVRLLTAKVQLFRKHWGRVGRVYAVAMLKMWALSRSLYMGLTLLIRRSSEKNSWGEVWRRRSEWTAHQS